MKIGTLGSRLMGGELGKPRALLVAQIACSGNDGLQHAHRFERM